MYVFILGLDHSRTTVVDMALGNGLGALSLGEVRRTAFPKGGEVQNLGTCACGASISECTVWQPLLTDFIPNIKQGLETGRIFIDSSKDIRHYRRLVEHFSPVLTVLTYRRFDSWYTSVMSSGKRNKTHSWRAIFRDKNFFLSNLRLNLRRYKPVAFLEWLVTYFRFFYVLTGPAFLVSHNRDVSRLIAMYSSRESVAENHIVRGNRVRLDRHFSLEAFDETDWFSNFLKRRLKRRTKISFG